tara:strand:- start:94 stop:702 length:609 start_codon:yes stop_codon:yes gene_type:complete
MRYFGFLCLVACGPEVPYSPTEQEFEDFDAWGDGIAGFDINQGGPVDTGNGNGGTGDGDVNGVYLGTYSVSISRENYGDTCSGSGNLTVAVAGEAISVGQGSPATIECGYCSDGMTTERSICEGSGYSWTTTTTESVSLKFNGSFDESGLIMGDVLEESIYVFTIPWTGVYVGGALTGSFDQYVSSNNGMVTVSGLVNVTKN